MADEITSRSRIVRPFQLPDFQQLPGKGGPSERCPCPGHVGGLALVGLKERGKGAVGFFNVSGGLVKGQGKTIHRFDNVCCLSAICWPGLCKRGVPCEQFGAPEYYMLPGCDCGTVVK